MKIFCYYLLLSISFYSFAQSSALENSLQIPREKVYLNLNKAYYFAGEKIKLDIAVTDAKTLENDTLSVPLYLELIDGQKGRLIERWILKIIEGKINTTIRIPDKLETNYYQIRAYTNWMRNFSPEAITEIDLLVFGQNYRENIPEISKSVLRNMSVHPESGVCVNGLINNLLVRTTDNFGKGIKSIVSLKSDTTTVRIFDTDENGEALVEFESVSGKSYYLESGLLRTDLPKSQEEGVIMRGYYVNDGRKLSVIMQNNLKKIEPLKMVLQTRGNNFYNTLIEPKKVTLFSLKTDSIPEGVLNMALIDLEGRVICERSFLNVKQDKNSKDNFLLFNSELDVPIDFTDKFFTNIQQVNAEMVNRRNVVFGFEELQKKAKTKNITTHKNELGLSISGKITDKDAPKIKDLINVSLTIKPEGNDTINQRQLFAVLPDKKGNFTFENLDFYGKVNLDVKASLGKKTFELNILNDSIPPIIRTLKAVDWRAFQDTTQQQSLNKEYVGVAEDRAKEERMKTKELEEVTVTSKKTLKSPMSMFNSEPSVRFLPKTLILSGVTSEFSSFFINNISFRLKKHQNPVIKFFVDDVLTLGDIVFEMPNNQIAYVDIHDGTADSNMAGASILINIYTIGYRVNPMVTKIMEESGQSATFKIQREGYHVSK